MGIVNGHSLLYSITNISFADIIAISKQRNRNALQINANRSAKPVIDFDASWIAHQCSRCVSPAHYVLSVGLLFAKEGFNVVLICDGVKRHHSKKATIARIFKRHHQKTSLFLNRCKYSKLVTEKNDSNCSISEKEGKELEILNLGNKIEKLDNTVHSFPIDVGQKFHEELFIAIDELTTDDFGTKGGSIKVLVAEFQADSLIAHRTNFYINDITLCADSDQIVLCGEKCLSIKKYKYKSNSRKENIDNFEIFSSNFRTIEQIAYTINLPTSSPTIKIPQYPVFENLVDIEVRALIAVGLGCDVYTSGVYNIGPRVIYDKLQNLQSINVSSNRYYMEILKLFSSYIQNKKEKQINKTNNDEDVANDEKMLNTFVESFINEPCNYFMYPNNDFDFDNRTNIYIHGREPSSLHQYNKDFARGNVNIQILPSVDCCVDVDCCIGIGVGEHLFLKQEGYVNCCVCNVVCCQTCHHKNNNQTYCANCYLPAYCENNSIDRNLTMETPTKSKTEMIEYLNSVGVNVSMSDNIKEIEEIFDAFQIPENILYDNNNIIELVTMPEKKTEYLQELIPISTFGFFDGGSIIFKNEHEKEDMVQLMDLLKMLVTFENNEINNQTNTTYQSIIPNIITMFANKSRVHTGERLLKRTVRHATDERTCKIVEAKGEIFRYKEKIGMKIIHKMKASMKPDTYNVIVAFTADTVVACSCNCKVGSVKDMKVICVHVLPVIYQLTLLLFQCLSEHILIELAAYISRENNIHLQDEVCYNNVHQFIIKMRIACQHTQHSDVIKPVHELLHEYEVGTQKLKKYIIRAGQYDILTHCPLRNLKFESPNTIAKKILNGEDKQNESETDDNSINSIDNIFIHKLTYQKICKTIHVVCKNLNKSDKQFLNKTLGFRLLSYRSGGWNFNTSYRLNTEMNEWKKLLDAANKNERDCNVYKRCNGNLSSNNQENMYNIFVDDSSTSSAVSYFDESDENVVVYRKLLSEICRKVDETPKHRFTCCNKSCEVTTTRKQNAIFSKVPKTSITTIDEHTSNRNRLTYYRETERRQIFLQRFGFTDYKTNNKNLMYCDDHELELETIEVNWLDINGNKKKFLCEVVVPIDPDLPCNRITRQQAEYRKAAPERRSGKKKIRGANSESPVKKKRFRARTCCHPHCSNTCCSTTRIKFKKIPSKKSHCQNNEATIGNNQLMVHAIRMKFRVEVLFRINLPLSDNRKDIRLCNKHELEKIKKEVDWVSNDKENRKAIVEMYVPVFQSISQTITARRLSSGLGAERAVAKKIQVAEEMLQNERLGSEERNALEWMLNRTITTTTTNDDDDNENNRMIGWNVLSTGIEQTKVNKRYCGNVKFTIDEIFDTEIKERTGFSSLVHLLSNTLIVCHGNFGVMGKTITRLTWFEEWLLYYESFWSKSADRWKDVARIYAVNSSTARKIFKNKLALIMKCRQRWPTFLLLDECMFLRQEKYKKGPFKNKRIIMWDNTDVGLLKPTSAELQRLTYSSYYNGCVSKGAIGLQTCGWIVTEELMTGGISDGEYMTKANIYQKQHEYVLKFDTNNIDKVWINVLDKGYRGASIEALAHGGQLVVQPIFAKCDRHFTTEEVLLSAAIASERGANERAVRHVKACSFISKGLRRNESPALLSDVWLAWGFEVNFFYDTVL